MPAAGSSVAVRFALALVLPALVVTCGGNGGEDAAPRVTRATAHRQVDDGVALLRTVIEVEFDQDVPVSTRDRPSSSYFDIDVPDPNARDGTTTISPTSVRLDGAVARLTVDVPVPRESVLYIDGAFFGNDAESQQIDISSTLTPLQAALAANVLVPLDPQVVTAGPPPEPAAADSRADAMKQALLDHLRERGSPEAVVGRASVEYDSFDPEMIPSPKLRAALASLTGTFAEPAITYLTTGTNCTNAPAALIDFQDIPDHPTLLARATRDDAGHRVISLRPDLAGERFEMLAPLLAHEAIHCDDEDTRAEEVAAVGFDTFLYLQLLTADPSLALEGTPLSRAFNIDAIAMINSGRRYPESLGILQSDGITTALPGSNSDVASFAELVANAYPSTPQSVPAPEVLAEAYVVLIASAAGVSPGPAFDLEYLDGLLGAAFDQLSLGQAIAALTLQPAR